MDYISGLISIIVPVYNVMDYLDKCIESIVRQTYQTIEIIIVDDGSTDGSEDICDRWKLKDERIRVVHKKNGGLSSARNIGISLARGEYLGFVDSDDYVKNDMYESLINYMKNEVDIVCCGRIYTYPKEMNKLCHTARVAPDVFIMSNQEAIQELLMTRYLDFSACTKIYRRELFAGIRFPEGKICEDMPTIYALVKRSRKVVNIGEAKYFNYYRENSISRKKFDMSRMSYILFARDILKDVTINYPMASKMAEALYIRNIVVIAEQIQRSELSKQNVYLLSRLGRLLGRMQIKIWINNYIPQKTKWDSFKICYLGLTKKLYDKVGKLI